MSKQIRKQTRARTVSKKKAAAKAVNGNGKKALPEEAAEKLRTIRQRNDQLRLALADLDLQVERLEQARQDAIKSIKENQEALQTAANEAMVALGFDMEKQRVNIDLNTMEATLVN